MVLGKSFYIHWSARRSPRVHEVNPGRDPSGQMVCYHCHQPRYMRRDCPQRQGSQGFGTAQSQSVVGQERIHYISPQPGTGQRSQSPFQGATQAPPISQVGPRGQSMGRGRGRGPQAGTSGV